MKNLRPVVYMETNRKNGTLYTGTTGNLPQRHQQHISGTGSHFCKKYGLNRLVWYEFHATIADAIAREDYIKDRRRSYKIKLIAQMNPDWNDLSNHLQDMGYPLH